MVQIKNDSYWREPSNERTYYIDLKYQGRIYVTKDIYDMYMRDEWAEWKRMERLTRCQITNDKNGIKRCQKDCKECTFFRNGKVVSLDELHEKYDFEVLDDSFSVVDVIENEELFNALHEEISKLDVVDQVILKMFSIGYSEKKIEKIMGLPRTTISYRKKVCFKILKEQLEKFYY